jgi:hypothetical protein
MRSDTRTHTLSQLAQTRQALARYLDENNRHAATPGSSAENLRGLPISPIFTDLFWMAVADKLLGQYTPMRRSIRDFTALKTTQVLLSATARTHPVGLVCGAAMVGAGVAATRPWRWFKCSDILPQLLSRLATQALANISKDQR